MDYLNEKNRKNLLKEFARRFPNEVIEILKFCKLQKKDKRFRIGLSIILDNPPDYFINRITRKEYKKFIKLKFPLNCRQLLATYMELDLLGKCPKLIVNLISN